MPMRGLTDVSFSPWANQVPWSLLLDTINTSIHKQHTINRPVLARYTLRTALSTAVDPNIKLRSLPAQLYAAAAPHAPAYAPVFFFLAAKGRSRRSASVRVQPSALWSATRGRGGSVWLSLTGTTCRVHVPQQTQQEQQHTQNDAQNTHVSEQCNSAGAGKKMDRMFAGTTHKHMSLLLPAALTLRVKNHCMNQRKTRGAKQQVLPSAHVPL